MKTETYEYLGRVCKGMVKAAEMIRTETDEISASGDHIAVVRNYNVLRLANEEIKSAREALSELESLISRTIIPGLFESKDVKTITVEGVGRVSVSHKFTCSIIDKTEAFKWLRSNDYGALIQETVNSSTLASFAKDMVVEQGRDLPDHLFKVGTLAYTSVTKGGVTKNVTTD